MSVKKLITLPPNLVNKFHQLCPEYTTAEWYCDSDPEDSKLGSGAGTTRLIDRWHTITGNDYSEKKIVIHAGGHSRRLPAYATSGKLLTPIPVLRWAWGEKLDRNLLSMQLPLYKHIINNAPESLTTLIACGDMYLRVDRNKIKIPEADVVCYGIWVDSKLASHHGVFMCDRSKPDNLDFMLQKPTVTTLSQLGKTHFFLMDTGVWLLSEKALKKLKLKSKDTDGNYTFYDLYSQFGCALGQNPSNPDSDLTDLSVAIVPLNDGEFYHFGTTRELLSSTLALQNLIYDQRLILRPDTKPNPALFTQNCIMDFRLTEKNNNVWVENSHISDRWTLTSNNVVTGIPDNDWHITLNENMCLDLEPIDEKAYAIRSYGYDDPMSGPISSAETIYMNQPLQQWLADREIKLEDTPDTDIQSAHLFAVTDNLDEAELIARWATTEPHLQAGKELWLKSERLSADEICSKANLTRLEHQRRNFLNKDIPLLAGNYRKSVFYQLDLNHLASRIAPTDIAIPQLLPANAPITQSMRNNIYRSRVLTLRGHNGETDESAAFRLMQNGLIESLGNKLCNPHLDTYFDQIVWARSPLRIDFAGGWTDTPPYSIEHGGNVVNAAIELNGQPPLQVFVKPSKHFQIIIHSIDMGASETISEYSQLADFHKVGSPFSLPKAALTLCGFSQQFCTERYASLNDQLRAFGSGIEITLLSAVPAGSGLGTSSILGSTILLALSDFCSLGWNADEICNRTLALEQLLTTGGGWQDQYGGMRPGIKLLRSTSGWLQRPTIDWLPEKIFTDTNLSPCHLLYYTGLTRTAKNILTEIVRRMMLNDGLTLDLLKEMRQHAEATAAAIQRCDYQMFARCIKQSWEYNKMLDNSTCTEAIQHIIDLIDDYSSGVKLTGAGGGGFLYIAAKDPEAAERIKQTLNKNITLSSARFVDMSISTTGTQISRS